jgi:hypothetical protein
MALNVLEKSLNLTLPDMYTNPVVRKVRIDRMQLPEKYKENFDVSQAKDLPREVSIEIE